MGEAESAHTTVLAIALLAAVFGTALTAGSVAVFWEWLQSSVGLLMAAHAVAAVVSGLIRESSASAIFRYVALVPAIAVCLYMARAGRQAAKSFQVGLTLSGLTFVAYHLAYLDSGSILDPYYRIRLFLNPNGVGFIAAMTAISLLGFIARERRTVSLMISVSVLACCLLCFATKSRTASLALLAGTLTYSYLRFRRSRSRALVIVAIGVAIWGTATTDIGGNLVGNIADIYMVNDRYRSMQSGTFRYEVWWFVISVLWPLNPMLGVGPGQHEPFVEAATNQIGAHNGLLANLAEVGLLGTLPLLAILLLCLVRARGNPMSGFALPLLAGGLVESVAETMFFSMGNPGSLLFLLSIAMLCQLPVRGATRVVVSTGIRVAEGT
jgi:O-antigen ligase